MTRAWGEDLSGRIFGRFTVLSEAQRIKGLRTWNCTCSCGNSKVVGHRDLKSGHTKSCGCLKNEMAKARITHGCSRRFEKTRAYTTWCGMIARCTIESASGYSQYGGCGIKVCDRWSKFEAFLSDMGEPLEGVSIDRIDSSIGYSPENCRWVSRQEQNENRRSVRWIVHNGMRMNVTQWADHLGLSKATLYEALEKYPIEYALRQRSSS